MVYALAGLAGIGAAAALTDNIDFSEGHAAVMSSGLQWGGWFGLIFGHLAGAEDNGQLRCALLGSDMAILSAAFAAKNVRMSNARMRLINLAGLVGTVFGFGIDLLIEVDDTATALAIAGAGSVAGLVLGTGVTRNYDRGRELAWRLHPSKPAINLALRQGANLHFGPTSLSVPAFANEKAARVPGISLRMNFSL